MKPRFAVIGLGRFGGRLAETLSQAGAEVLGVDRDRETIEAMRDKVTLAVRLDSTDAEAMRLQGVDKVSAAVVGMGTDFEAAVLTVAVLRSFDIPRIICRAQSERRGRILSQVGADIIVLPEAESAARWSHRLMLPDLRQVLELGEGHSLVQIPPPASFHHHTPAQLRLRQKFNVNLVAINRVVLARDSETGREDPRQTVTIPEPDTQILPTDLLILVGSNESLDQLLNP